MRAAIQAAIGKALLVLEEPIVELSATTTVPSTTVPSTTVPSTTVPSATPVARWAPVRAAKDPRD